MTFSSASLNLTKAETSVVSGAEQFNISLTGKKPDESFFSYPFTKKGFMLATSTGM